MKCSKCQVKRIIKPQTSYPNWIFSVCPECGMKFATENKLMQNFNIH